MSLWPNLSGGEVIDLLTGLRGGADGNLRRELIEEFEFDPRKKARTYCRPSLYLTMAASSPVTMPGYEKAPPEDSGGAFIVMVPWWSSVVTRTYSLFSVIADCAAARSTIALSAA